MDFDLPINNIDIPNTAGKTLSADGYDVTFTNDGNNGNQGSPTSSPLMLSFQLSFDSAFGLPDIFSITLDGVEQCFSKRRKRSHEVS